MASYPYLNYQQYSYAPVHQPVPTQASEIEEEEVSLTQQPVEDGRKSQIMQLAQGLESPAQNAKFLEAYYRSALKVEQLSVSLKRLSLAMGAVALLFFASSAFSFVQEVSQRASSIYGVLEDASQHQSERLQASQSTSESGLRTGLSAATWGLVLAKLKAGHTAASSH